MIEFAPKIQIRNGLEFNIGSSTANISPVNWDVFIKESLQMLNSLLADHQQFNLTDPSYGPVALRMEYNILPTDLTLNANASLITGDAFLFFNLGIFVCLQDLFLTVCSYNNFFENVWIDEFKGCGVIKLDGQFNGRFINYSELESLTNLEQTYLLNYRVPTDPIRIKLSRILLRIGFIWIVCHEEAHYTWGHLHYIKDHNSSNLVNLMEVGSKNESTNLLPDLYRQVFELQADGTAASAIIDIFLHEFYINELPSNLKSPVDMLHIILVAIGSILLAFEKANKQFETKSYSHPLPGTRMIGIVQSIFGRVLLKNPWTEQGLFKIRYGDFLESLTRSLDDLSIVSEICDLKESEGIYSNLISDITACILPNVDDTQLKTEVAKEWRNLRRLEYSEVGILIAPYRRQATPEFSKEVDIYYKNIADQFKYEIDYDITGFNAPNTEFDQHMNISGTSWSSIDSDGDRYEFNFLANGDLYYISPKGSFKNAKWAQKNNYIYFYLNHGFSEYEGNIQGDTINGTARNKRGYMWSWLAKLINKDSK